MDPNKRRRQFVERQVDEKHRKTKKMPTIEKMEDEEGDVEKEIDSLECEDPFEDEVDEEEIVDEDPDPEGERYGMDVENGEEEEAQQLKVFRPGVDSLQEDEILDYDSNVYEMLHRMNVEWPCLSFDILTDKLGSHRTKFPLTAYFVAGTQASSENSILVMKVSDLHKTKHDDDESDDDSESDDDFDDDPILEYRSIKHRGVINRIRAMPQKPQIVATWSENSQVYVYDVGSELRSLDVAGQKHKPTQPIYSFASHTAEGFAMDWSPVAEGRLLTGDSHKHIYLWNPTPGGNWEVDKVPFSSHNSSVEDIQWSPREERVFASCSSDATVKIFDTRRKAAPALSVKAHSSDVNVISWSRRLPSMLLSGGDDGAIIAWDLRKFVESSPQSFFQWHKGPISSIEWSAEEDSVFAASSLDNTITIWDLAVEDDAEQEPSSNSDHIQDLNIPPQLLFIHQGVEDPKEVHWHPQIPGVIMSTSANGFNIFKTINSSSLTAEPETEISSSSSP